MTAQIKSEVGIPEFIGHLLTQINEGSCSSADMTFLLDTLVQKIDYADPQIDKYIEELRVLTNSGNYDKASITFVLINLVRMFQEIENDATVAKVLNIAQAGIIHNKEKETVCPGGKEKE